MGIKNFSMSFALVATLSLQALADNTSIYIQEEQKAIKSAKQYLISTTKNTEISIIFKELQVSSEQFNNNVIKFLNSKITDFAKEDSQKTGMLLANLALHNDEKIKFYKEIKKIVKKNKFSKDMKTDLVLLEHISQDFQKEIQKFIDVSYMEIEAKNHFRALKLIHTGYQFNDYWYSSTDVYSENVVLFLSLDNKGEDIFDTEDKLNKELLSLQSLKKDMTEDIKLPSVGGFDFDKMNKTHFTRVSLI
ncbi:MAG: hypothetical protein U9R50_12005 [Campylobacterota bacterium]|nr:hypothetical protein [Campylobacterota bacterium]